MQQRSQQSPVLIVMVEVTVLIDVLHAEAKAAASDVEEIQLTFVEKVKALRGALQPAYWQALIVVSLLYFARFDASFITLRARTVSPPNPCTDGARLSPCLKSQICKNLPDFY